MAIKYIPFYTPLEGQAVLGNFIRTKRLLDYRGNKDVVIRHAARRTRRQQSRW